MKRGFVLAAWLAAFIYPGRAGQTAIRFYTLADGLPGNTVHSIIEDSYGFLWFATPEGLSRFNGYEFTSYSSEIGLPSTCVTDLLETRPGEYLIGTSEGLCRLKAGPRPVCEAIHPLEAENRRVTNLHRDRRGGIWAGSMAGLDRLETGPAGTPVLRREKIFGQCRDCAVEAIFDDRHGDLWVGTAQGLFRRAPGGRFVRYDRTNGLPDNHVLAIAEDRAGRLWLATTAGLCRVVPEPGLEGNIIERVYTASGGLSLAWIQVLLLTRDGRMVIVGGKTAAYWNPPDPPEPLARTAGEFQAAREDRLGNLWLGDRGYGVARIAPSGFTTFTAADGLAGDRIDAIFESRAGELCVLTKFERPGRATKALAVLEGDRFRTVHPAFPKSIRNYGWGWLQIGLQDRLGDWWFATGEGLCRFPAVRKAADLARTPPKAVYGAQDGLRSGDIFRIYEDSRGGIWVDAGATVARWDRARKTFETEPLPEGFAPGSSAFADDGNGAVWIGYYKGGVARHRNGRLQAFSGADGAPTGTVRQIHRDHRGRLWIAAPRNGLARVDDPSAEHPRFRWITTADGLASNQAYCLAEDRWGRIYVAHGRGVDRLDPDTGRVRHYTTADGLLAGEINTCFTRSDGSLWFGSHSGVSRLMPEAEDAAAVPPPVYITGLRLRGAPRPLSLAEREVRDIELAPRDNHLQIDFAAVSLGEPLRYRYRLEGAGAHWSEPAETRTVNYASLEPGRYRFQARSVNSRGVEGQEAASVSFTIAPPLWRRWWFIALANAVLFVLLYGFYRFRIAHLLAIERMRTRIATDLHDDIGASLSRVAILSEVVKRDIAQDQPQSGRLLGDIADTARSLVDSMSDIVWSIDPRQDHLDDVLLRVRQFASDVFEGSGIEWRFEIPAESGQISSRAEQRRHVFLIFKEALNNAVRHAQCRAVTISVSVSGGRFRGVVSDDGRGGAEARTGGNGLDSMRVRARSLRGRLDIESPRGGGTRVTFDFPLASGGESWWSRMFMRLPEHREKR